MAYGTNEEGYYVQASYGSLRYTKNILDLSSAACVMNIFTEKMLTRFVSLVHT